MIAGIVLLATFSCKKSDSEDNNSGPKIRLSRITNNLGVFSFTYDAQGRLTTERFLPASPSNYAYTATYTEYTSDGSLSKYSFDYDNVAVDDFRAETIFDAQGRVSRLFQFFANTGASAGYYLIEYSGNTSTRKYYASNGTLNSIYEQTASADGKNLVQSKDYSSTGALRVTNQYLNYDDKNNPRSLLPKGYNIGVNSINNYQAASSTNASTGVTSNFTYTFEYNAEGYATKQTSASGGVATYEYITIY